MFLRYRLAARPDENADVDAAGRGGAFFSYTELVDGTAALFELAPRDQRCDRGCCSR